MKSTILTIMILLLSLQITAQTYDKIIPVEDGKSVMQEDGMYFKDVHHIFDQYKGTWEGTLDGKTYKINLKKATEETNYVAKIKEEYIQLRYEIIENGEEIINTLLLPGDNGLVCPGNQIYNKNNHINYYFVYGGKEILCGQSGDLLVQTTDDPDKLRLKLYPDGEPISDKECPNGPAEQVFPTDDWLVLHKKED